MKKDPLSINRLTFNSPEAVSCFSKIGLTTVESRIWKKWHPDSENTLRILVPGCGCGRVPIPLAQEGHIVWGYDISEEMVAAARKAAKKLELTEANIYIYLGDASLPQGRFSPSFFNVVWFPFNGIDYTMPVVKRYSAIAEISRVLKKDGIFIYSSHVLHIPLKRKMFFSVLKAILNGQLLTKNQVKVKRYFGHLIRYEGCGQKKELKRNGFNLLEKIPGMEKYKYRLYTPWMYFVARKT